MTANFRGILYKSEMIQALLNTKVGSWPAEPIDPSKPFKWQTRRLVSPQPEPHAKGWLWRGGTKLREAGGGSWSRKNRPRLDKAPTETKLLWEAV